jgi:hypothetical protein
MAIPEYAQPNIQKTQSRQDYIRQFVNETYEQIVDPTADPAIQPKVQLLEGWQNGNIHFDTVAPPVIPVAPIPPTFPHTWDIWCVVSATPDPVTGWTEILSTYVRLP